MAKSDGSDAELLVARRHFVAGWWGLLLFAAGGLVLEAMHGLKVPQYLDVSNETRRLMWTLAHAHGTLLSVLNLLFAFSLRLFPGIVAAHRTLVSVSLLGATVLLPLGFFAGGLFVFGGDPGLGVLAVPFGAVLLLLALLLLATAARRLPADSGGRSSSGGSRR
jgi:hypothetical protein